MELTLFCSLGSQLLKHTRCWPSLPEFGIRTILSGCTINKGWWHLGTMSGDALQPLRCLEKNTASWSKWLCSDHTEYQGKTRTVMLFRVLSLENSQGSLPGWQTCLRQPCTPPGLHTLVLPRGVTVHCVPSLCPVFPSLVKHPHQCTHIFYYLPSLKNN